MAKNTLLDGDLLWIFTIVSLIAAIPLCLSYGKVLSRSVEFNKCRCGEWNDELQSRIVGGMKVTPHRYPWLAMVLKYDKFHCGGSVINSQYILTAGHCVYDEESRERLPKEVFGAILGVHDREQGNESSRQHFRIIGIKVPVLFQGDPMHDIHDLGLLKLDRKIEYSFAIKPVCLPTSKRFTYVGRYGIISGWGTLSFKGPLSVYPLEAAVEIISNEECLQRKIVGPHFSENTKAMFCAYEVNRDACQGDSGGPLVVQEGPKIVQIGIISWGIECALRGYPGVYTRLTYYIEWIYNNTMDAVYCDE